MGQRTKRAIDHFNNGFMSYPSGRICYPDNVSDENEWLAGWYRAKAINDVELQSIGFSAPAGLDGDWWQYKLG